MQTAMTTGSRPCYYSLPVNLGFQINTMVYNRPKKGWSQFINGLFAPMSIPNYSHKETANASVFSSKIFWEEKKKLQLLTVLRPLSLLHHLPASPYFTVSVVLICSHDKAIS